ncbi:MAG: phytoene synthase [Candidatus Marinimicrobia bacterium]|nr:phytoene synthase [Candidatus Neomarinimicrobiota bacterium]
MKYLYDDSSIKISKLITNQYSTSFSFSSRLLKKDIRMAIYSIYGFVRLADEIVDSFHDYDKETLLNKLQVDYKNAIENKISINPILHSFQKVYHEYNFEPYLVDKFFESMKMDLCSNNYNNELYNQYIHGSAEVVGLMCLKVFVKGNKQKYLSLKNSAMKLGAAFQKVNFLRDLEYDNIELGRTYFPEVDFENMTSEHKNKIIESIEDDFDEAFIGLRKLNRDSFFGVYIAYRYYKELLLKIKKTHLNQLKNERIRISNFKKMSLILNSVIKFNLRLI